MAVKVFKDKGGVSTDYDRGSLVRIENGHLVVTSNDTGDVVAVYAPGTWHHADVI